jgi:hypothetical protein
MYTNPIKSKDDKYNQLHQAGTNLLKALEVFVSRAEKEDGIAHIKVTLESDGELALIKMFGRRYLVGFDIDIETETIGRIVMYKSEKRSDIWSDYFVPIKTNFIFDRYGDITNEVTNNPLNDFEKQLIAFYNLFNEQFSSE